MKIEALKGLLMKIGKMLQAMEGGALATPEAPVRLGPDSQELAPPFIYTIGFRFRGGE